MAKKITGFIKLQIQAGKANPAPPVGPALGQHGVNIMDFCKSFNAETQEKGGDLIPVEITVYADRSFSFITKTPPAARLILKAAKIKKGNSTVYKKDDNDLEDYLIQEGLKNTIFENTQHSQVAGEDLKQFIYVSRKTKNLVIS